jgi:ketosteroid isomerase-like protein
MSGSSPRTLVLSSLVALSIAGAVGLSPSQEASRERPKAGPGDEAAALRQAASRFVESADRGDVAAITAAYDPEFTCVRVADEGGFAKLSRDQMLGFFGKAVAQGKGKGGGGGHAIPTKETTIHHAEAIGDTGFVLLTRVKDLGHGWEPMFYTLVWRKAGGEWRLLREYVHQKSIPKRL